MRIAQPSNDVEAVVQLVNCTEVVRGFAYVGAGGNETQAKSASALASNIRPRCAVAYAEKRSC